MADLRIKTAFVSAVLRETAEFIQSRQRKVVREWNLFGDDKELYNSLSGHFSVTDRQAGGLLTMRYLKYARFLDMKDKRRNLKPGGYHLYNRIVFGTLYNTTANTLKYGLTGDIFKAIKEDIAEAYKLGMPYYKASVVGLKVAPKINQTSFILRDAIRGGYQ